jgi:hypothetical protein
VTQAVSAQLIISAPCLLSLDKSASSAAKFSGNGSLNFKWPEDGEGDVPLPELMEDMEGYTKPVLVN